MDCTLSYCYILPFIFLLAQTTPNNQVKVNLQFWIEIQVINSNAVFLIYFLLNVVDNNTEQGFKNGH